MMINQIRKHPRLAGIAIFWAGYYLGRNNWDFNVSFKKVEK